MLIVDEQNWIEKELKDKGFDLFDFFENYQVMDLDSFCSLPLQRRSEILLVNTQTLLDHPRLQEKFQTIINTFMGVVFFHEQKNQKAQEWVLNQAAFITKILGEYALPMPQLQWTMLSNQMQFFWNVLQEQRQLQKHMTAFSQELDQVMRTAESEMIRAKKIHEVLIPKRSEEIKGVHFTNKYAAGDGGGGEFYDLYQTPQKVYQILVSSQSYLISSALLGLLNKYKEQEFNPTAFLKDAKAEIATINDSKKKKSHVDIMLLELDLTQLVLTSHNPSQAEFVSLQNGVVSLDAPYKLSKSEKFFLFSPGFMMNWKEVQTRLDIHTFLNSQASKETNELLTELFFQLKLDRTSEFLKKDATTVIMEVNRHGIHKV